MYSGDEDNGDDITSGPAPEPECECIDSGAGHWSEDEFGNEIRIDCGCPCAECREY